MLDAALIALLWDAKKADHHSPVARLKHQHAVRAEQRVRGGGGPMEGLGNAAADGRRLAKLQPAS